MYDRRAMTATQKPFRCGRWPRPGSCIPAEFMNLAVPLTSVGRRCGGRVLRRAAPASHHHLLLPPADCSFPARRPLQPWMRPPAASARMPTTTTPKSRGLTAPNCIGERSLPDPPRTVFINNCHSLQGLYPKVRKDLPRTKSTGSTRARS
ncbi:hypothetical protein BDV95DRAFT_561237 [Massariosphaeria phaeospora]|uniref:Uncharacterized protein n=1 Tax=Massariosphaeria phaeospora TaxID=100035 RepID=A0A7C8IHQ3_9PLEO|nr:hypothetical protein BDV95DRAFT_561237 [Massariosphaeria phaeospora]